MIDVLYEDEHIIAVEKPPGMLTHPCGTSEEFTVVHALRELCGERLCSLDGQDKAGIVHRLDRFTSGVMLAAKTDMAFLKLRHLFRIRRIYKRYDAVVAGIPMLSSGEVRIGILEEDPIHHKMAASVDGKYAVTKWRRVESLGDSYAHLHCEIETGRTHQIRVHLSFIGYPVLGDYKYGYRPTMGIARPPSRVLLHSNTIAFVHPICMREIEIESVVPADILTYLNMIRETCS